MDCRPLGRFTFSSGTAAGSVVVIVMVPLMIGLVTSRPSSGMISLVTSVARFSLRSSGPPGVAGSVRASPSRSVASVGAALTGAATAASSTAHTTAKVRIDQFTYNMLFDEKMGDRVHLGLGRAYEWTVGENRERNDSTQHMDMIVDMSEDSYITVDGAVVQLDDTFVFKHDFK